MNTPQLLVFAGPNGAGKSTLSATMLAEGTPIFDGDKEFAKLKRQFDSTDSGTLYDAVNGPIFEAWKKEQLATKRDCAFETNFRSAEVMQTIAQFKAQGYQTSLLWFSLPTISDAIERVALRVKSGGHQVSLENIRANFTEGLKNLEQFYKDFDRVECYQNLTASGQDLAIKHYLSVEKGTLISQVDDLPDQLAFFKKDARKSRGHKL